MTAPLPPHTDFSDVEALEAIYWLANEALRCLPSGEVDSQTAAFPTTREKANPLPPSSGSTSRGGTSLEGKDRPRLSTEGKIEAGEALNAARKALIDVGALRVLERLDVIQLGEFLSRLLSGEAVEAYVRNSRAAAKLAPDLLGLVERALGQSAEQGRFSDIGEFAAAIAEVLRHRRELPFPRLGHFILMERIGRGGMGEVYRAYEPALERLVAVKLLPAEFAAGEPELAQRFHNEATAIARLDHPNVVHIHAIGEDRGHHFFAMQLVEGETLAHLLRRQGRLGVDETLKIIEQVLLGLQAAA